MSARGKVVVLALANALLVATLILGIWLRSDRGTAQEPLFYLDVAQARVLSLTLPRAGGDAQTVVLEKEAVWDLVVDDERYPARADRVEPFLDVLAGARVVREVTSDAELHPEFGLESFSDGAAASVARRVSVVSSAAEATVLFGSAESPGDLVYARRQGDDQVLLVRAAADFYLNQSPSFWAYLRLFPESARPDLVVALSVFPAVANASLSLIRDPGEREERWVIHGVAGANAANEMTRGRDAEPGAVASLVRDFIEVAGTGFYSGDDFQRLPVLATVEAELADGRTFGLELRGAGETIVARPDGPALPGERYGGLRYTIAPATLRRILPDPGTLLGE